MKVIGITGYVGTGKSSVSKIFKSKGIYYFDSDSYVSYLNKNKRITSEIKKYFPSCVLNNSIDKIKLRTEVFKNYEKNISILEKIYHPYVYKKVKNIIFFSKIFFRKAILLEVPLLFQSKIDKLCDVLILVSCLEETQIKRAMERSKIKREDLDKIMNKQKLLIYDNMSFNYIINTEDSLESVKEKVDIILKEIM